MSPLRVDFNPEMLRDLRASMAAEGVELTPAQLKKMIFHMVQIADVLATKQLTFEINEDMDVVLNMESETLVIINYDKEEG